jgi:hypothetical protein
VQTDGWTGYTGLPKLGDMHEIIRKNASLGKNLLPKINRIAALVKHWLLGSYQVRIEPSHLEYYHDEYTFRFNRRTCRSRGKLFYRLVEQAIAVGPVLKKSLYDQVETS